MLTIRIDKFHQESGRKTTATTKSTPATEITGTVVASRTMEPRSESVGRIEEAAVTRLKVRN